MMRHGLEKGMRRKRRIPFLCAGDRTAIMAAGRAAKSLLADVVFDWRQVRSGVTF
jgi:hypothetical protein